MPAALLSMIAACAVTAEGKQTIRGIGNERNGANRAHSGSSNITAPQTTRIRGRFLNLKCKVFPYKDGEKCNRVGAILGMAGDPSPSSYFPKCESIFPEAMRAFLFGRRLRPRLSFALSFQMEGSGLASAIDDNDRESCNHSWSPSLQSGAKSPLLSF